MSLDAISTFVSKAAPILGNVLTGNFPAAAVSLITSVFGGSSNDLPDLLNRLQSDPQAAVKLAQIQSEHILELKAVENDRLKIEGEFSNNPGVREAEKAKAGVVDNTQRYLAFGIIGIWLLYPLTSLIFHFTLSHTIDATLGSQAGIILGYYFVNNFDKKNRTDDK